MIQHGCYFQITQNHVMKCTLDIVILQSMKFTKSIVDASDEKHWIVIMSLENEMLININHAHHLSQLSQLHYSDVTWASRHIKLPNNSIVIMKMSPNGNIFRVTGDLCGEFTGPRWIPRQRPVTRSFDVFFDLLLNNRLSKQSWSWWFETLPWSLWHECDVQHFFRMIWKFFRISALLTPLFVESTNVWWISFTKGQ